jgi:hypothetical protein
MGPSAGSALWTGAAQTSENTAKAKFAENPFYEKR